MAGPDVSGRSPLVDELLGGAGPAQVLGEERTLADEQRGGPVSASGLVPATGQPRAHIGRDDERRARASQGSDQGAHGPV